MAASIAAIDRGFMEAGQTGIVATGRCDHADGLRSRRRWLPMRAAHETLQQILRPQSLDTTSMPRLWQAPIQITCPVLACIQAGKTVLYDKPLFRSLVECVWELEPAGGEGARLIQSGFMRRCKRSCAKMKKTLADGTSGRGP